MNQSDATDPVAIFVALCVARAKNITSPTAGSGGIMREASNTAYECTDLRCPGVGNEIAWGAASAVLAQAGILKMTLPATQSGALAALVRKFPGIDTATREAILAATKK